MLPGGERREPRWETGKRSGQDGRCRPACGCLAAVSLLNDVASEAIYPLLPFFLTTVLGATAVSLGVIEGAAEAVSSVLKIISGRVSDRWGRRKPIVIVGYSLSAAARPFISIAAGWCMVFVAAIHRSRGKGHSRRAARCDARRLADQTNRGKGVRLSSRDGSHRCGARAAARDGVSPRAPGPLSHAVRADGDSGRRDSRSVAMGARNATARHAQLSDPNP